MPEDEDLPKQILENRYDPRKWDQECLGPLKKRSTVNILRNTCFYSPDTRTKNKTSQKRRTGAGRELSYLQHDNWMTDVSAT